MHTARARTTNLLSRELASVRQAASFLFEGIGKALHAQYADIAREPLPPRLHDLVTFLDKKEENQKRVSAASERSLGERCHPKQCPTRNIGQIARKRRSCKPRK